MNITTLKESTAEERRMLHEALMDIGPAVGYAVVAPDHSPNGVIGYILAVEAATIDTARRSAISHRQPRIFQRLHEGDVVTWVEKKVRDE